MNSLIPKKFELQQLMKYFDVDGDNHISYLEFITALRYIFKILIV